MKPINQQFFEVHCSYDAVHISQNDQTVTPGYVSGSEIATTKNNTSKFSTMHHSTCQILTTWGKINRWDSVSIIWAIKFYSYIQNKLYTK